MLGAALSCHAVAEGGTFPEDAKPPGLDICWGVDRLVPVSLSFYRVVLFLPVYFYLRRSPCGVYACIPGRATIFDNTEMDPNIQVYAVRCAWAPAGVSNLISQ
jgi:hypothetical protein